MSLWVPGALCWARDPDLAFAEASVVEARGETVTVELSGLGRPGTVQRRCAAAELLPRSAEQRCAAELDDLQELHMASVLNSVELLFCQQQCAIPGEGPSTIYSSVGPVLIAMNPFAPLPIYGEEWIKAYRAASGDPAANKALGPHCYRAVEEAYSRLRAVRHQSVVICGESGAGKTVTNKKMIEYLCQVARRPVKGKALIVGADPQQITEANVLLEAFGNAKTTRNDNSSRFGKYTKLTFDPEAGYAISGCHVDHYLLERTRVASHQPSERNYHVFYQLLASAHCDAYGLLRDPELYRYTRDSAPINGACDTEDAAQLWQGMTKVGFDAETRDEIFKAVAAILHLGNVEFKGDSDSCEVSPDSNSALASACGLLGIDDKAFARAITSNVIKPPSGAPIWRELGVDAARGQRDTVAKTVYSRLFDHVVRFLGYRLKRTRSGGLTGHDDTEVVVGLLDIFGFEDMAINGFEQLFINLTNERIQYLFNNIMFERELEAYKREGIAAAFDPGEGNLACVRLFTSSSNPPGIVKLLSESALMKSGRDGAAFVQVLNTSMGGHGSFKVCDPQDAQRVSKAKGLKAAARGGAALDYRECFQVRHYAGTVMYTVSGWVPKSMDALLQHLSDVLRASSKPYVRDLFEQEDALGKATVGEKFCAQLEVLAGTLEQGETLFVRCIKSNPQMVPGLVNRREVLEQLVNGGVIAALEMRHRGLPDRMEYEAFCSAYGLLNEEAKSKKDFKLQCKLLLQEIWGEDEFGQKYAFGHTKVFMKGHVHAVLRAAVALRNRNVAKRVQRQWRIHTGTERIRKVQVAWEQFLEAERVANSHSIETLPTVHRALANGRGKIQRVVKLLEDLTNAHGTNVHKIGASLPPDMTTPLYSTAEDVKVAVDRVVQRKAEAEQLLGYRITRAMDTVHRLSERVVRVEEECDELAETVDPAEIELCRAACRAAGTRLEGLRREDLPELRRLGPVGVNLEAEGELSVQEAEISPKADELLEQAAGLVAGAERLGHEVLRVRRAFQQALKQVQGQQEEAQMALEALHERSQRCVAEGLGGVVEKVGAAWQCREEAQAALQAAKDAGAYRAAVEAFVSAVREAQAAVERGREELARREAEREERGALQEQLDSLQQRLVESRDSLHKSLATGLPASLGVQLCPDVAGLLDEIATLRGRAGGPLAEWQAQVMDVDLRTNALIKAMGKRTSEASKARQEEFNRRMSLFNNSPEKKKAEDDLGEPVAYIRAEGLAEHEGPLLEILRLMETLKDDGAQRSGVQRCVTHFMRSTWGAGPATPSGPPASPVRFR